MQYMALWASRGLYNSSWYIMQFSENFLGKFDLPKHIKSYSKLGYTYYISIYF